MNKRVVGQAFNRAQDYVYTWFDDGTVVRCYHRRLSDDAFATIVMGSEETVTPPVQWNERDFLAFVPVEPGQK